MIKQLLSAGELSRTVLTTWLWQMYFVSTMICVIQALLSAGELPITMLACARIGAVHSVVFAGFSAESLASRVEDCKSRVVVTTSGVMRGKKKLETKKIVDDALEYSKRDGFEVGHRVSFHYGYSAQCLSGARPYS